MSPRYFLAAPRRTVLLMTKRWLELRRQRGVQEVFRIRDGSRPCDGRVEGLEEIGVWVDAGQLRRLAQRVEKGRDLGAAEGS